MEKNTSCRKKDMDWPQNAVLKLIELWSNSTCLYNTAHSLYKNQHARADALYKISEELKEILPLVSPKDVKTKILNLRSQYTRELAKVYNSKKSEAGVDEIYVSRVYWFKKMEFLKDFISTRKMKSSVDQDELGTPLLDDTIGLDTDFGESNSNSIMSPPPPKKTKRSNDDISISETILEQASTAIEKVTEAMATPSSSKRIEHRPEVETLGELFKVEFSKLKDEELINDFHLKLLLLLHEYKTKQIELNKENI